MRPLSDSGSRKEISPLIHKEPSCSLSFCPYFLLIPLPFSLIMSFLSFSSLTSSYSLSPPPPHPSLRSTHYICPLLPPTLKSDTMLPHLLRGGSGFPRRYWFCHGSGPIRFERKLACRVKAARGNENHPFPLLLCLRCHLHKNSLFSAIFQICSRLSRMCLRWVFYCSSSPHQSKLMLCRRGPSVSSV